MHNNIKGNKGGSGIGEYAPGVHNSGLKAEAPSTRSIFGLIFLHQFISSFAYPVSKLGLNQIDPYSFAFFRFAVSSLIFTVVLLIRNEKGRILPADRLKMVAIGLILIPGNQLLFLIGQSLTTASNASLLFATTPIFIYVLAIFILREKFLIRRTIGILIAIVGVYLNYFRRQNSIRDTKPGG